MFPSPLRFYLVLSLSLLLGNCARPPGEKAPPPTETVARLVGEMPAGLVGAHEALRVRFVAPVAGEHLVGQPLSRQVFSFSPPIVGKAVWEDRRTLVFQPHQPLTRRQQYRGKLELAAFFPQHRDLAPLQWDFAVAGRELRSVEVDFALVEAGAPRWLRYQGEVVFTEAIPIETLRPAVQLRLEGKAVALTWQGEGQRFRFASAPIERLDQEQRLVLAIDERMLELSQPYRREFTLPPQRTMQAMRFEVLTGERPMVAVEFSDELDGRQQIAGLIGVEPPQPLQLKVIGRKVLVQGEFAHGQRYTLFVHPGIRSRWGSATGQLQREELIFADRKPQFRFARDGVFLPAAKGRKIRFQTLNLSRVEVEIKKVFADNLGHFLHYERLSSPRQRRDEFADYYVRRVGVELSRDTLEVAGPRNVWLQHELELSRLLDPQDQGLYLVSLRFGEEDMLYGTAGEREEYRRQPRRFSHEDYFGHPYSPGYIHAQGRVFKALAQSDIGLTCKKAHRRLLVWATRLEDASPLSGVEVRLRTYQNQVIGRAITGADGLADFGDLDEEVFYVEAEKDGQRSLVKPDEMAWNLAAFDTGGQQVSPDGIQAFIYTERGVFRPGDLIRVGAIVRHADHTFPDDHPLALKVFNPRDQLAFEQTQVRGRDGFYVFAFDTDEDAPTGNWRMELLAGSRLFTETLKIETIVPQRLKIEIIPDPPHLGPADKTLAVALQSEYLFGAPAAGLEAWVTATLRGVPREFSRYPGFTFADETVEYTAVQTEIFRGLLDEQGKAQIAWPLPAIDQAPAALEVTLIARVLEPGGRPNQRQVRAPLDPHAYYVGLQKPEFDYGYATVGTQVRIPVVVVDHRGEPVPGRLLRYRVYRGNLRWWWEYEGQDEYRLRFRSAQSTEMVAEGELTAGDTPQMLAVELENEGRYLIEVRDSGGHLAAFFLQAYPWGATASGGEDASLLGLRLDRESYAPGETAVLRFPLPGEGAALISVEQDARVLNAQWYPVDGRQQEARFEIPISAAMAPNAYAVVSLIQPYAQTANDRPLRLYGIVPLQVEDPHTRRQLELEVPEVLRPDERFAVVVQTADRQPTQFTLAVVDEGLLALTDFATPDPWRAFFGKVRLAVHSFDLFAQVIGAHQGDVFRTFSIGGDLALDRRLAAEEQEHRRRFTPVSLFEGPLTTDARGRARVEFDLPNYVGAVRVMAVAAQGRRYGHAEKTVPVRSELMVLPTLPRVLGPGDRLVLPVTVFALEDGVGRVEVRLDVKGPATVQGPASQVVELPGAGEAVVEFPLQVAPAVGALDFELRATSSRARAGYAAQVQIRPSALPAYAVEERALAPGDTVRLRIPDRGIAGSNQASLRVHRGPDLALEHRFAELLQYPYGCLEQLVSAAFPQLYLKGLVEVEPQQRREWEEGVDAVIDQAIVRLRRYQRPDGSFAFWPGGGQAAPWADCYAGHFLLAARELGYHLPGELLADWLRHQQSQALAARDELRVRVYRVYLLSLAGAPSVAAMNLLREHSLETLDDTEKWLLAAAYRLAGIGEAADQLARRAGLQTVHYSEFTSTYGSRLRDQAIILNMLVEFEAWEQADPLAGELAQALSMPGWHSTQTTGFALMALGQYRRRMARQDQPLLVGLVRLPDGQEIPFHTRQATFPVSLESGFGSEVVVELAADAEVERAFVALSWEGIPLQEAGQDEARHLKLEVEWLDEHGLPLDPTRLVQGTAFWAHFRVRNAGYAGRMTDVALSQLLPAGWEIENIRLSGAQRPGWMGNWNLGGETYLDLRDDRASWFFDLAEGQALDFIVALQAVTVGEFFLPATQVEAMYHRDFRAVRAGGPVVVEKE